LSEAAEFDSSELASAEGEPDDSPEYFRAKEEWVAYWKRIHVGLASGADDDPGVVLARIANQFGICQVRIALCEYIKNSPSNFERRWRKRHEARLREEKKAQQNARNPHMAGRKSKRSEIVLMTVWLLVERTKSFQRTTALAACKLLVKAPSRRSASRWPGFLLYNDPCSGGYYVQTPENLRDIYYDALRHYSLGSDGLKRSWDTILETLLGSRSQH
jgi:hypothetical protein